VVRAVLGEQVLREPVRPVLAITGPDIALGIQRRAIISNGGMVILLSS